LFLLSACSTGVFAAEVEPEVPQVWKVTIEGNQTFSDVLIKDQIAADDFSFWEKLKFWNRSGHKFDEIEVKKDVIRIRNYYQRRGFPYVQVRYEVKEGNKAWKREVTYIINEQQPISIKEIIFNFDGKEKY